MDSPETRTRWAAELTRRARAHWTAERTAELARGKALWLPPADAAPLLRALGLLRADASMPPPQVRKFFQINHMVSVLEPALRDLRARHPTIRLLDAGCGRSYLTLLLAWCARHRWHHDLQVLGVDRNAAVIDECRRRTQLAQLDDVVRFEATALDRLDVTAAFDRAFGCARGTASRTAPGPAPRIASGTASDPAPDTASRIASDRAFDTASRIASDRAFGTASDTAPDTASDTAPGTASGRAFATASDTAPGADPGTDPGTASITASGPAPSTTDAASHTTDTVDGTAGAIHGVIALHACDTATCDALALGVALHAELIAVAPCCQAELARAWTALDAAGAAGAFAPIWGAPHLRRETAAHLTDAMRTLLLRAAGYDVRALEFVPAEHTPKNTMLRAVKRGPADPAAHAAYQALCAATGGPGLALADRLPR